MNFAAYVEQNYSNTSPETIHRDFASATKLNSVLGDKQDSIISPLRTEFYAELAMLAGGVTAFGSGIAFEDSHNAAPAITFAASCAVASLGNIIRRRAVRAINTIFR